MAEDTEILRECFQSNVPVCFVLADNEVFSAQRPDRLYLDLPRIAYFPLVTDKVNKYFSKFVDSDNIGEMWFDHDGTPIRWQYPIGVLYDLATTSSEKYSTGSLSSSSANQHMPLCLRVHFRDFPERDLIHCVNHEAVESHFISTVKEADCLKHRSSVVNSLQARELRQLYTSLAANRFDQFWVVNRKLMDRGTDGYFRNIPFKVHKSGHADTYPIQFLFKPTDDTTNKERTLNDLLKSALGDEWKDGCDASVRVVIHGIDVPLETPVQWISEHMSYPDNFLHVCVIKAT